MILIIGATGNTGRVAVAKLLEQGLPVRVLTRDPERARTLPGFSGAELVTGDATHPEALGPAFAGVEQVYFIPPSTNDFHIAGEGVIAAARQAGVRYLVKISTMCAAASAPSNALSYHFHGEQRLRESGIPFTILRPNSFMQNFFHYAPSIKYAGALYHCLGDAKMALVDTQDVAEVAAALLQIKGAGHEGKSYDLTGPEALTYAEAVEKIAAATGRPVQCVDVPPPAYEQMLLGLGMTAAQAAEVVNLYGRGPYREGQGAELSSATTDILGRAPRSFADFARDHSALFLP